VAVAVVDLLRVSGFATFGGVGTAGEERTAGGKVDHIRRLAGNGKEPF
jgi:hypothetical protein